MPSDATFTEEVPGLGEFTFRKRSIRDQIGIQAEAVRMLGGPTTDDQLWSIALAFGTLAALTVQAPKGWDLEALDPLDPTETAKLWTVYGVLRAAEDKFRKGA